MALEELSPEESFVQKRLPCHKVYAINEESVGRQKD